jgi:lipopolysaccharide/colanic/teichoic acid biosynthesis glycosyltransferase
VRDPIFKRPFDAVLSGVGLVITLPLWIVFAAWIWLESGRPIFFRQIRIGRNGKPFRVIKFRSMVQDPRREEVQAAKRDPRITRVGRLMRMLAMDELPQIWSIFVGNMRSSPFGTFPASRCDKWLRRDSRVSRRSSRRGTFLTGTSSNTI